MIIEAFFAFYLSLVEYNIFRLIIYAKHLVNSKTSSTFAPRKGEVLEWLKRHAWKACILQKGIRGSNPRLSAELTGQNRTVSRQVPQIQRFVGLFLSPYVCPTGHHLAPKRQS